MKKHFGYVYSAWTQANCRVGLQKIGSTTDVEKRMKQLSSHTSQPQHFRSHTWFRCENIKDAKEIEKYVHRELTKLGLRPNPNREFFSNAVPLENVVMEAADELDIRVLSNRQLNCPKSLFLPCRYFLLQPYQILTDFLEYSESAITTMLDYGGFFETNDFWNQPWREMFSEPNYPLDNYLRDFDKTPYIIAKISGALYPNPERILNHLKSQCEEEIFDYFDYNENWRERFRKIAI